VQALDRYTEIWVIDFEFNQRGRKGNPSHPVCVVAQELHSQRVIKLWGREMDVPPFDLTQPNVLTLGFYFPAESGCMAELGWGRPVNVIDLFAEFRTLTNGLRLPQGNSLLGACAYFGINAMAAHEKYEMRDLILRGGPFNDEEKQEILNYCAGDVFATGKLFAAMLVQLSPHWGHALARGKYTEVLGRVEHRGIPIDTDTHRRLVVQWDSIQSSLIEVIDRDFDVFEDGSFRNSKFMEYLVREAIPWPRLDSGALALDDSTFKDQSRAYPQLMPLRELRSTLGQLRLNKIGVGEDGRSRCMLSPFRSKTGRNQPSNNQFIFGPSAWMRSLIKPPEGMSLAYCDYARQEFGIAAAYSSDDAMKAAYRSKDAYITFARMAGAVPENATKKSHPQERAKFKLVALAVQYGMTTYGLKNRSGMTHAEARQLLQLHKRTFPAYWAWGEQVESYGTLTRQLRTSLGWRIQYPQSNPLNLRSMRNWPVQSTGADMLRMTMIALEDVGIEVIAPVHDAVLIQAPTTKIYDVVEETKSIMRRVSGQMLSGFWLEVDTDIVSWPARYVDPRGKRMWNELMGILECQ
jgi:DNA polymerase-1